jgi:hypothetical protein
LGLKINIRTFRGATPGTTDNLLTAESAVVAENCNFEEGDLRSFFEASLTKVLDVNSALTLNKYNNEFITKEAFVDFVDSPLANDLYDRKYYTGEGSFRALANDLEYPEYYEPGPQQPSIQPDVIEKMSGSGTEEERSYSFTFVSRYGEEGAPSPITAYPENPFKNDSEVFISKIEAPELGHAITQLRLYRTATGSYNPSEYYYVKDYDLPEIAVWESGSSTADNGDVVSYDNDNGNILYKCLYDSCGDDPDDTTYGINGSSPRWEYYKIVDDVTTYEMLSAGIICPSEEYLPAPNELNGIIGVNGGMLAGFYGKNIIFSIPNHPHAWPAKELTTEYEIVGLGHYGGVTIAFTKGSPIFYAGTHPDNMSEIGSGDKHPCISKRSIVSGKSGCLYATTHGLARTSLDGTIIATEEILTKRDWDDLFPENIHGYMLHGQYFGFNVMSGKSFLINFKRGDYTTLSDIVYAAYVPPEGNKLYMVVDGDTGYLIKEWEGKPYSHRKYTWRSKWFDMGRKETIVAARLTIDETYYNRILDIMAEDASVIEDNEDLLNYVGAWGDRYTAEWGDDYTGEWGGSEEILGLLNDNEINLYELNGDGLTATTGITLSKDVTLSIFINGDEDNAIATRTINHNNPFKLKGKYKSRRVQFLLEGYVPVDSIELATSIRALNE